MGSKHDDRDLWADAWTFQDYVISLYQDCQTHSREFKVLEKFHGRERLDGIWDTYKRSLKVHHESQPQRNQIHAQKNTSLHPEKEVKEKDCAPKKA